MKSIKAVASAFLLFTLCFSRSAYAEWWIGGWNGEFNYFIDIDSVMRVDSVGKVKAWIAFVKEGEQERVASKTHKGKSSGVGKASNEVYRILMYVSCDDWTSKNVRVLLIDRKTRDVLHSSNSGNAYIGYTDIDTESVGNDIAKIMCAADPRSVAKGMGWGAIESDDDYISASETFFKVTRYLNASRAAKAAGRQPPPAPPEVVEWLDRKLEAEGLADQEEPEIESEPESEDEGEVEQTGQSVPEWGIPLRKPTN